MPATSSVPRLKDRGGAGAKIVAPKPSKPLTPVPSTKPITGKENPNYARVPAMKSVTRPFPGAFGNSAGRLATSSVPRGRSISPFTRSSSAGKNERLTGRVSLDGREVHRENQVNVSSLGVKSSEGSGNGSIVLKKSLPCERSEMKLGDSSGLGTLVAVASDTNVEGVVSSVERCGLDVNINVDNGALTEKESELMSSVREKPPSSTRLSEKSKVVLSSDGSKGEVSIKYQSRLHEKLAFLEGKVKRIASDIKKTKEMLDLNKPDESKVILSDIQEKISGIEKAMSHAIGVSGVTTGDSKENANDNGESGKSIEKIEGVVGNSLKSSVKELSSEELEARLFPHHKLLRNRASLKTLKVEDEVSTRVDTMQLDLTSKKLMNTEIVASFREEQLKDSDQGRQFEVEEVDGEMDIALSSETEDEVIDRKGVTEMVLTTDESLVEFDDQENRKGLIIDEMNEDTSECQPKQIGCKITTGGWFVSEGEAILLVHSDGSCSYYDVSNGEEKAEYNPSMDVSPNIWRDCWIVRAPGADGCSGRFVVAASAGNSMEAGFCSWEFYSKDVRAFHIEGRGPTANRTVLEPLSTNTSYRRNVLSNAALVSENPQWWYRPCGPLIISTASSQRGVRVYDIRDGEHIMKWETQKPVVSMDYSSPLQWRSRGKVVVAEGGGVSLWDVNSLIPQALSAVSSSGRKISALHVNNTDAEIGGGVRQRVSSSEAEGHDGVFCTQDSIEVLDFRQPSGIGFKVKNPGLISVESVFSRGDSIFLGCMSCKSGPKRSAVTQLQQFSLRKQSLMGAYNLPDASNVHSSHSAITQVWGNSNLVMGVSGLGLFVFDSVKDDSLHLFSSSTDNYGMSSKFKEVIGPDDLYSPSFDYSSSRALVISRDRPAIWQYSA
ncbi:hypothetical protein SAY87_023615 [Trapa incisa]|uniref:At4g14310 8-bladed propeller domain-containing protein n=1 Tax=Trapa incisa TaxID=236973 RepID=A0AAN7QQJ0_9MYRT|nr:hypothetical protein SAY87_023615 [Trapa incisa]